MREPIDNLLELFKSTERTERDVENFNYLAKCLDNNRLLRELQDLEKDFEKVLENLTVGKFADLCGYSRPHIYRLLENNSRIELYKKLHFLK